jgi:hypothetical protein
MSRRSSLRRRYGISKHATRKPCGHKISATGLSLPELGTELSFVINRVRRAYGPVSMASVSDSSQVQQAERAINQTAQGVRAGYNGQCDWQKVLREYEAVWMDLLVQIRQSERCAA